MEYNKLAPSEIDSFKTIMKKYKTYHDDLALLEFNVNSLTEKKNEILEELNQMLIETKEIISNIEKVRQEEKELKEKLSAKYGPFKLNLETFEINKHNK